MNTFSLSTSSNITVTPAWVKSERYEYCDSFAADYTGHSRKSFVRMIQKLFNR